MKNLFILISGVFSILLSVSSNAASLEIKWTNIEKFADVRADYTGVTEYREYIVFNIEKHFKKLASKLPENQTLRVEVQDIDLAGDIKMFDARLIRVVKQGQPPRIAFNYQLIDVNKNIIKGGDENIRNASFMNTISSRLKNSAFGFEKSLLNKWYKKSLKPLESS